MENKTFPITPPPELVNKWDKECESGNNPEVNNTFDALQQFATKAARWGADQELEACINYFHKYDTSWGEDSELIEGLRAARRPKPLSLKAQALAALVAADGADHPVVATVITADQHALIRRALESLPS